MVLVLFFSVCCADNATFDQLGTFNGGGGVFEVSITKNRCQDAENGRA